MSRIKGKDAYLRTLKAMPAAVKRELAKALDENADAAVTLMKSLAPVDDGDLRESIRKENGEHELQRRVLAGGAKTTRPVRDGVTSPSFDYALKAESEQPFFHVSLRATKKSNLARLGRAYRKAAKSVVSGGGSDA